MLHPVRATNDRHLSIPLEELGVDYRIQFYQRNSKTMLAPPEHVQVHPLGKSPVITDGDTTVAESGAIIEYLVDRYGGGKLRPAAGSEEFNRYRYWLHYAEGTLMPLLVMQLILGTVPKRAPALVRPIAKGIVAGVQRGYLTPNLKLNFSYLEAESARSTWLAGNEFSAADIQMSFALEAGEKRAAQYGFGPKLAELLARMRARPAYQRALSKGGPVILG